MRTHRCSGHAPSHADRTPSSHNAVRWWRPGTVDKVEVDPGQPRLSTARLQSLAVLELLAILIPTRELSIRALSGTLRCDRLRVPAEQPETCAAAAAHDCSHAPEHTRQQL